jgi:Cytochrome c oxidase subunit IV
MAEELRFFLRTAVYSAGIAVIYWFASYDPVTDAYDWAGTALLSAAAVATGATVAVAAAFARGALHGGSGRSPVGAVVDWIGLTDPGGRADEQPLATDLDALPRTSSWPLVAGVAATLIGLGLVYGAWLWMPGAALLALSVWGWVTQLRG